MSNNVWDDQKYIVWQAKLRCWMVMLKKAFTNFVFRLNDFWISDFPSVKLMMMFEMNGRIVLIKLEAFHSKEDWFQYYWHQHFPRFSRAPPELLTYNKDEQYNPFLHTWNKKKTKIKRMEIFISNIKFKDTFFRFNFLIVDGTLPPKANRI